MVTLDYLRGLPEPSFGVGFDRSAITNNAVAAIQGVVSGWEYTGRGRLARALDAIIETIWTYGEINQAQAIRTLGAFAVGNDLTHLAAADGIMRRTGEGDEDLRRRWTESSVLLSVGTNARNEANAFTALAAVADVQARVRTNRQDVDLYALKADLATLSDAEWDDVIQYGNSRSEIIMGVTVHRANPTIVEYSTALAVTYHSSRIDQVSLEASIEAQLERYIDDARVLGRPVNASAIIAATLQDPLTTPDIVPTITRTSNMVTGNLAATAGTVYDGSVGAFTFTKLTP